METKRPVHYERGNFCTNLVKSVSKVVSKFMAVMCVAIYTVFFEILEKLERSVGEENVRH